MSVACPSGTARRHHAPGRGGSIWRGILPALGLSAILLASATAASEDQATGPAAAPFSSGERLFYRVEWDPPWYLFFLPKMEAGELELALSADADYEQKPVWRITFKARSSGTLSRLADLHVDDHFESIADRTTFCTYEVTKRIMEGRRKREIHVKYYHRERRLHVRELDVARVPPRTVKDRQKDGLPVCVRDVFASLYALRMEKLTIGSVRKWTIGDDDVVKEVETRALRLETVQGPSGPIPGLLIDTVALLGGLFKEGGQFRIWLSNDERRLPLKFQVQVKLGKVDGRLVSVGRP